MDGAVIDAVEVVYRGLCEQCSRTGTAATIDLSEHADVREPGDERLAEAPSAPKR